MNQKKIIFTGGGTAGHVTPNIALMEWLQPDHWQIEYIGSAFGIEKSMMEAIDVPFHSIRCGKWRRYWSWKNIYDPINLLIGILQAYRLLGRLKPNVVFSKGGFVAVPVVFAAWLRRIPIIAHESDMTPGLANRLSFPFVNHICLAFAAARAHVHDTHKVRVTGTPIRRGLLVGNAERGLALCGFNEQKPRLLIMGGSQGSRVINDCVRSSLEALTRVFQVIHLCGHGHLESGLSTQPGYYQLEYADASLPDLFAASDVVLSRAGANTVCELLALAKPHVLVPLSRLSSRGDQIQNARYFEQAGVSVVIDESELTPTHLLQSLERVLNQKEAIILKIRELGVDLAAATLLEIITLYSGDVCTS